MLRKFFPIALLLSLVTPGYGATASISFGVTVTVLAKCDVSAVTHYASYAEAIEKADGAIAMSCNNFAPYTVEMTEAGGGEYTGNPEGRRALDILRKAPSGLDRSAGWARPASTPLADSDAANRLILTISY